VGWEKVSSGWAALVLTHQTADNLLLTIPPEMFPTVQEIVVKVKDKQLFYSKKQ
jgi:hypothetical protein